MKCPDQLIRLYSSTKGEVSADTEVGGLYLYNLLKVLKNSTISRLDIVSAHNEAAQIVISESLNTQHPSRIVPRLPFDSLLPGAIN